MPWNSDGGAGFTTGTPWLPIGPTAGFQNVASESADPESVLSMYRHLIHLRAESPALREGDYRAIDPGNGYVLGFVRETELQRFLVLLNFDSKPAPVTLHGPVGAWVAGTHVIEGDGQIAESGKLELAAYEGRVFELRQGKAS